MTMATMQRKPRAARDTGPQPGDKTQAQVSLRKFSLLQKSQLSETSVRQSPRRTDMARLGQARIP